MTDIDITPAAEAKDDDLRVIALAMAAKFPAQRALSDDELDDITIDQLELTKLIKHETRLEEARRIAKRDVDSKERKKADQDPEFRSTLLTREYDRLKANTEAKKLLASELRIEEPEVDLGALFDQITDPEDGDYQPQAGRLLDDTCGLLYSGTSNGIFGKSGIGKTLIQAALQVEAMTDGGNVVHWEFDNNANKVIVRRLVQAGATRDMVVNQFKILRAEEEMETVSESFSTGVTLVTLDAITPAITAVGGEVNHPSGMDLAIRTFLAPYTVNGATGFFVGHVGHENQDRQAGSNRMFAAVQGALYLAEVVKQPHKGDVGLVTLTLKKDNQGEAGEVGSLAAYARYDSTAEDGSLKVTFTRQRGAQDVAQEMEQQFQDRLSQGRTTEEQEITLILKVLAAEGSALNQSGLFVKLQDMGSPVSERKLKARLKKMTDDNMVFVDQNASKGKEGRPSDHYRACALPQGGDWTA